MGSRLLPLSLALGALTADVAGVHHLASYLVLLAVVGAAAAAIVGVGEWIEGKGGLVRAVSVTLALVLLLVGSADRTAAPVGAHVPALAVSSLVLAALVYAVPLLVWLAEPLAPRPRTAKPRARLRTHP